MKKTLLLTALFAAVQLLNAQTLIPFTDGDKWGYCDQDMNIVIPLQYKNCEPFYPNGLAIVRTTNTDYHLINKRGENILEMGSHDVYQMDDEVLVYEHWSSYYFFNIREQKKHEETFSFLGIFSGGLAPYISKSEKKDIGYINLNGEKFFRNKFESVGSFHEGLAYVEQKGKFGYIGTDGKMAIKPEYDDAGNFSNGLAYVVKEGKLGYIDKTGKMVIPAIYDLIHDYVSTFRDNLVIAEKEGKQGCIDITGSIVVPFTYEKLFYEGEGLFSTFLPDEDKLFDRSGKEITGENIKYFGSGFSEGWITAQRNDDKGSFMNKDGRFLLPFIFSYTSDFENGYANCFMDNKGFFIDKTGKMYCTFAMPLEKLSPDLRDILAKQELVDYVNGNWIVRKDGLINVFETDGSKALPETFIVYRESSGIIYMKDDQGKHHFYTGNKFEQVRGEPESILRKAVMTDELMAWYKLYNDTVPELRKTNQIRIGDQVWATSDLKVRTFRNGEPVPEAKTTAEFSEISNKKQPCFYCPETGIYEEAAYVYNYYALKDKRGLLPQGWKVPTRNEWTELLNFAGGDTIAGNYLSRFGFMNKGWIMLDGQHQKTIPSWWTADQSAPGFHYSMMMFLPLGGLMKAIDYTGDESGFAIRCIKEALPEKKTQLQK